MTTTDNVQKQTKAKGIDWAGAGAALFGVVIGLALWYIGISAFIVTVTSSKFLTNLFPVLALSIGAAVAYILLSFFEIRCVPTWDSITSGPLGGPIFWIIIVLIDVGGVYNPLYDWLSSLQLELFKARIAFEPGSTPLVVMAGFGSVAVALMAEPFTTHFFRDFRKALGGGTT